MAYDELDKFHWNEKDLAAYEERVMNVYKDDNILALKLDIATQKGIEQGRKEEKLAVARSLLKAGVSIEVISQSTGLSVDEIKLTN